MEPQSAGEGREEDHVSASGSRSSDVVRFVGDTRIETKFEGCVRLAAGYVALSLTAAAHGAQYRDRETYPDPGQLVRVHYRGKLVDGTVFESSRERGHPLEFRVGIGQVVQGVDEGILDMSKGERALLRVPPQEGYGAVGMPPRIPPDATLLWDVELIDVKDAPVRSLHALRVVNSGE